MEEKKDASQGGAEESCCGGKCRCGLAFCLCRTVMVLLVIAAGIGLFYWGKHVGSRGAAPQDPAPVEAPATPQ